MIETAARNANDMLTNESWDISCVGIQSIDMEQVSQTSFWDVWNSKYSLDPGAAPVCLTRWVVRHKRQLRRECKHSILYHRARWLRDQTLIRDSLQ